MMPHLMGYGGVFTAKHIVIQSYLIAKVKSTHGTGHINGIARIIWATMCQGIDESQIS